MAAGLPAPHPLFSLSVPGLAPGFRSLFAFWLGGASVTGSTPVVTLFKPIWRGRRR